MHAVVGDEVIIGGHRVGRPDRRGEILEVRGDNGAPPYLVRWDDGDHATLFFPGSDCLVKHLADHPGGERATS
jgi:hypothetical protein